MNPSRSLSGLQLLQFLCHGSRVIDSYTVGIIIVAIVIIIITGIYVCIIYAYINIYV